MKIFHSKKPPAASSAAFHFIVQERFDLRDDGGTALEGILSEGEVRLGDWADCLDAAGRVLFTCQINTIQLPGQPGVRPDTVSAGGRCRLLIRDRTREELFSVIALTDRKA
ncbi:MAG: hypothetical protein PUC47_13500 [Oscillospiraceae bacterium]|nr:hypothetical protein [Oscillospiraceae bacterium]